MNTTIAKYMSLAVTVVIIAGLVYVSMVNTLSGEADKYKKHLNDNMSDIIISESGMPPP